MPCGERWITSIRILSPHYRGGLDCYDEHGNEQRTSMYLPLMTAARRANPSKRLTNRSSTIPVPQLMTIAANRGTQPSQRRWLTLRLRRVTTAQPTAATARMMIMMRGKGVLIRTMLTDDARPSKRRVTRSPRHAAIGGAMLSKWN